MQDFDNLQFSKAVKIDPSSEAITCGGSELECKKNHGERMRHWYKCDNRMKTDLFSFGCTYSKKETSTPNGSNDLSSGVGAKYQSHCRCMSFHCSPQGSLGIVGELVGAVDDHNFEPTTSPRVQLSALPNLFQNVLYHCSIPLSYICRSEFKVIVGFDNLNVQPSTRWGEEDLLFDSQFSCPRTKELLKSSERMIG